MRVAAEFICDASLEGLFSAFAVALAENEEPSGFVYAGQEASGSLFGVRRLETNPAAAADLLKRVATAGGHTAMRTILLLHLADSLNLSLPLFRYVRDTILQCRCIDGWFTNPDVRQVTAAAAKVRREIHRCKGLLRFSSLADGSFYAPLAPDHNILLPLAQHFAVRLRQRAWVIHDRKRNTAVLWDGRDLHPALPDIPEPGPDDLAEDEMLYRECWRQFTRHVSIRERQNPRLQAAFMPRRYWDFLTEVQVPTAAGSGECGASSSTSKPPCG